MFKNLGMHENQKGAKSMGVRKNGGAKNKGVKIKGARKFKGIRYTYSYNSIIWYAFLESIR